MNNLNLIGGEVCAVLREIPKSEYNKIPKETLEVFKKYEKYSEDVKIDKDKRLEEQNISKEAKDIIFAFSLNYWLPEEERKQIIEKMQLNENKMKEKYDIDKIFMTNSKKYCENPDAKSTNKESIIEVKNKWYVNLFNKIKSLFKIRNR